MDLKAFTAEFIGTFALIFVGVGSIAMNHATAGSIGLVGIALAHGLTIAAFASATMLISGGQFNPAVTISLFCTQKIDSLRALTFIIAQCLGAISGAAMLYLCLPTELLQAVKIGTPQIASEITLPMGLLTEIILTFFLMFVIYGTAVESDNPKTGALFIGLAVTLAVFMGGPTTGAAMNPARHLGPALMGGGIQNIWLYSVGPISGAVLAGIAYKFIYEPKTT